MVPRVQDVEPRGSRRVPTPVSELVDVRVPCEAVLDRATAVAISQLRPLVPPAPPRSTDSRSRRVHLEYDPSGAWVPAVEHPDIVLAPWRLVQLSHASGSLFG